MPRKGREGVIGQRIRRQRLTLGLTQEQLADSIGATQAAVALWESGKRIPGGENVRALSAALGLRASTLLGEANDSLARAWQNGFEAGQASARRTLESALRELASTQEVAG
jgi:transcriptional regulator with XRE-family HTH domain